MSESFDEFLSRVLDRAVLCLRPRSDEFVKIFRHLRLLATKTCEQSVLVLVMVVGSISSQAQSRSVDRSKALILSQRDSSNRRYICDASVVPARLGIVKSQTKSSIRYGRPTPGSTKSKATIECRRKIAKRVCGDTLDNDADGKIDFPNDSDCQSSVGAYEGTTNVLPPTNATAIPIPTSGPILPLIGRPFKSTFRLTNFFDHDVPREFVDKNGYSRIATGETLTDNIDGHQGYDFSMPEGTELIAVADGVVEGAGLQNPFLCPLLNKTVQGNYVRIRHTTPSGTYFSLYLHLSRIDVSEGQTVTEGSLLGLSGNTGCSTGPHLHFDIQQLNSSNRYVSVDPFGWSGTDTDPWALDPDGLSSRYLWKPNAAPEIYREANLSPNPNAGDRAPVAITSIRHMGFNDTTNPNNEFVQIQVDARFAKTVPYDLTGFYILTNSGERFDFPAGTTVNTGETLTIRVGSGQPQSGTLFWNRPSGVFDNNGDCARLMRKDGSRMYYLFYGENGCTGVSAKKLNSRKVSQPRDMLAPSR